MRVLETDVLDERVAGVPTGLFDNGTFRAGSTGQTLDVTDPATDRIIARVSWGTVDDAAAVIRSASAALEGWRQVPGPERGRLLSDLYDVVIEHQDWLSTIITAEEGKPLAEARGEVLYAAGFFRWAAEEAHRVGGGTLPANDPAKRILYLRQGVGVTAAITPWNFPIAMLARKLGPALAAGCTQVIKPASQTPLTALALCRLVQEAGFPAGTVNLVTGPAARIAETWLADPVLRKLSFTGSTEVGQRLIEMSSRNVTRLSLELGGHAPVIVFPDVDLGAAVTEAVRGKFRNTGQSCISPNRFYVHEDIYEEFVERFAADAATLVVGPGDRDGVAIGPLIDDPAVEKVRGHVRDAVDRGARVVTGGSTIGMGPGHTDRFMAPTVIADCRPDMLVMKDETFGPVAPVVPFRREAEVVRAANETVYGLAAYFFTSDVGRIFRVAEQLDYGVIGINDCLPSTAQAPFGGMKHSGYGREGGHFVMHEYLETKYLSLRVPGPRD